VGRVGLLLACAVSVTPRVARGERVILVDGPVDGSGLEGHALRLLGGRLERLGARVVSPEAVARFGARSFSGPELRLELDLEGRARAEAPMRLVARLGERAPVAAAGRARDLDALVDALASGLSSSTTTAAVAFEDERLPFDVHRLLGRAQRHLRQGARRRARLLFERAVDRSPGALSVLALRAARRLRGSPSPTLVASSLERLDDAKRRGEASAALEAALDAYRFGVRARRRWRVELPPGRREVWVDERAVEVASDVFWVRVDAGTGALLGRGAVGAAPFGVAHDDLLFHEGRRLARRRREGAVRWETRLPPGFDAHARRSGGGQVAVWGPSGVAWVEASLGSLGQAEAGVRVLAVGEAGALVLGPEGETRLLRPGRRAATWTTTVAADVRAGQLTGARALLFTKERLHLVDTHDGRSVGAALPMPPRARVLAAEGRYAVVGEGGGRLAFVDVLAGAVVARVEGPARPVGAHVGDFAVAALFSSGDLLHWDFDGLFLDRARVAGRPVAVHRGAPTAPGPVVETDAALVAYGEVEPAARYDVDVLLAAARAAAAAGRDRDARVLARAVARSGDGRVAEAERLRARLLEGAAADAAAVRARAAGDPARALPAFAGR
jgi:hypothetical protein